MPVAWRRLAPFGAVLLPLVLLPILRLTGDRSAPTEPQAVAAPPAPRPSPPPEEAPRESDRVEKIVQSQKKRIMGRKKSLLYVRRVAEEVGPLVARALEQPAIQADLRALAQEMGLTLPAYKEYFQRKQEADLLLESGGDPNARSVANAIGVAQWLASTGSYQGLRIDAAASRQLTAKIDRLQADLEALQARPPTFVRAAPAWWKPSAATQAVARANEGTTGRADTAEVSAAAEAAKIAEASAIPAGGSPAASAPASMETPGATDPSSSDGGTAPALTSPPTQIVAPSPLHQPPTTDHRPPTTALSPSPPAASPPGGHVWTRDQWIAHRKRELSQLMAKRRQVDERYDPAKAIAAQTRYLVRLSRRYGSLDWALQAYHGGEGGVSRTVAYYLGDRRAQFASTEGAIRGVLPSRGGAPVRVRPHLSYADLYFGITPRTHPQAFGYLFGRSDDHRYYWWKVLMAERAIALYRRDPEEFERQWQALRPGQRMEAAWYPEHEALSFRDVAALRRAYARGELVRPPADLRARGIELGNVAPLDAANAYHYKGLRPEAMGALLRIAALYRQHGGRAPLRVLSLTQTTQYAALLDQRYPTPPPKEPVGPADVTIDLHPTGLTFDLQRPAADWDRKVLEYALGLLSDRLEIYWMTERERGPSRYHVTPNPAHAKSLARHLPGPKRS